jgi:hypothetical protein
MQGDSRQTRYVMGVDFSDSASAKDCYIDHSLFSKVGRFVASHSGE